MPKKLINLKKQYFNYLDRKARHIARKLTKKQKVTKLLLDYISELYDSANTEKDFSNDNFQSAYHQPITSELEFLLARIFYHFSNMQKLGWSIRLRKQKKSDRIGKLVAPDIQIEKKGKVIAVIEIKAKAGWMQTFFSDKRALSDKEKGRDPEKIIKKARDQLMKYSCIDGCNKNKIFVFLPTFAHVDRKKYNDTVENYRKTFANNSTLNKENLIVLSRNASLNLSATNERKTYLPTEDFERFIKNIKRS